MGGGGFEFSKCIKCYLKENTYLHSVPFHRFAPFFYISVDFCVEYVNEVIS